MNNFSAYDITENERKGKKKNKGIVCDVKNCVYHDGKNSCTAEQIAVGPSYASCCADTVCATFKAKTL